MISISPRNTKMGEIPSVSLPPVVTCSKDLPCYKLCYAKKMTVRFKTVLCAWERNLKVYQRSSEAYFDQVRAWLTKHHPKYFRWHVGGDCPYAEYFQQVTRMSEEFPETKFLIFTKRYSWVPDVPDNMNVLLSMWPGVETDVIGNKAWLEGDPRAPEDGFKCVGTCDECLHCWNLNENKQDVILKLH